MARLLTPLIFRYPIPLRGPGIAGPHSYIDGRIDSSESIPGFLIRLQIWALAQGASGWADPGGGVAGCAPLLRPHPPQHQVIKGTIAGEFSCLSCQIKRLGFFTQVETHQ